MTGRRPAPADAPTPSSRAIPGGCPACGGPPPRSFFRTPPLPVFCNVQWESRAAALEAARGVIDLGWCERCDLISNVAFDPAVLRYGQAYENALHHSAVFRDYAAELAGDIVRRHGLRGATVVEIGCGQGDFLRLLCAVGECEGFGFDPGYDPQRGGELPPEVTILAEPYAPGLLRRPADLVCCRHVLEHMDRPLEFLTGLREAVDGRALLFFEVPNALWTLRSLGIWDVIYEHCCYYTPRALAGLFDRAGFDVLAVRETYGGQFLTIEARPRTSGAATGGAPAQPDAAALVEPFASAWEKYVTAWCGRFDQGMARPAIWGAGSKGVTFLNVLELDDRRLPLAVDQNPHKQGRFVAGTAQRIVAPAALKALDPTDVVIMNPLYRAEIGEQLEALGLCPRVHSA